MQLRAEEISRIIKKQIASYDKTVEVMETGTVLTVGDGIARVYGLDSAHGRRAGRVPRRPDGHGAEPRSGQRRRRAVRHATRAIREGDTVKRTGRIIDVPVGEALVGRVVNALGEPVDGKGPIDVAPSAGASRSRRPASCSASRSTSRCRPASRRSTR